MFSRTSLSESSTSPPGSAEIQRGVPSRATYTTCRRPVLLRTAFRSPLRSQSRFRWVQSPPGERTLAARWSAEFVCALYTHNEPAVGLDEEPQGHGQVRQMVNDLCVPFASIKPSQPEIPGWLPGREPEGVIASQDQYSEKVLRHTPSEPAGLPLAAAAWAANTVSLAIGSLYTATGAPLVSTRRSTALRPVCRVYHFGPGPRG